jgi:hypothetical protein
MSVGVCPVCNGTGKGENDRECRNCGGQQMYGRATGKVNLRQDGTPCKHEYNSTTIGRCLTRYKCTHCSYQFDIDSGD